MTDRVKEQISAWIDGELADEEVELVIARLESDEGLRRRWARYHLMGDMLRSPGQVPVRTGIPARVAHALAGEHAHEFDERTGRWHNETWLKPVASVAAAAAVMVVALFALSRTGTVGQDEASSVADLPGADVSPVTAVDGDRVQLRTRLNTYLVNHSEYASIARRQGMLPYVHVASGKEPVPGGDERTGEDPDESR